MYATYILHTIGEYPTQNELERVQEESNESFLEKTKMNGDTHILNMIRLEGE